MFVYCITNKINHKKYIGITTKTVEERWKQHLLVAYNKSNKDYNSLFKKAIRKYGKENWLIESIYETSSLQDLKEKEIYFIKIFKSYAFDEDGWGYNSTRGGDYVSGYFEVPVSQFVIVSGQKIKDFRSIAEAEEEIGLRIERIGEFNQSCGGFCWFYTKDIQNLSNKDLIDKVHSLYPNLVYKLDLEGKILQIYRNSTKAGEDNNCSSGNIISCCLGTRNQANGFQWCYQKDISIRKNQKVKLPKTKQVGVIQYDLSGLKIKEYASIKEAAEENNCSESHISSCCRGKRNITANSQWRYSDEKLENVKELSIKRQVKCIETQEIFNSPNQAAKHFGYAQQTVKRSCMGEKINKPFHFEWI